MKKLTKAELIEKYAELEDKFYKKSDECGDLRRDNDRLDTVNVELQDKVQRLENQIHYLAWMLWDKVKLYYRNYSWLFDVEIKFWDEEDNDKPFSSPFTYCNK